ncbi:MAG: hypothetical protein KatS3mg131_2967 [Candidatus Tectimicrobiota bacterium]|nr:MAG: hypothetical protein KatS3mg131_2967 [Candidatus Tectomicrobia bacterium]
MSSDIEAKIAELWNTMDESWESYGKILEDKAAMNAGKIAIVTEHEQITYDQLDERVNRVGNALEALGVKKGDKVCVMLPNTPEFLYVWWGNAKLGGITVPLNTALKGEGLAYIINHSDAETLVISHRYLPALEEIREQLSNLKRLIVLGPGGGATFAPAAGRHRLRGAADCSGHQPAQRSVVGRHRLDHVHLGHHRLAQRGHPPPLALLRRLRLAHYDRLHRRGCGL